MVSVLLTKSPEINRQKSGVSYTKVFGNTLVDIAEEDKTIVAINRRNDQRNRP